MKSSNASKPKPGRPKRRLRFHAEGPLLEAVIRYAPIGIGILEGPEHRYIIVNPEFQPFVRGKGDVVGRTVRDVFPEVAETIVPLLDGVYRTGEKYSAVDTPFRLVRDGRCEDAFFTFIYAPWYGPAGRIRGVMSLAFETTGRKVAEDALRVSEERFRQLANAMPQLVWTAEPDGTVDYYNDRVHEFEGFHRGPAGNWIWEPVLHPDDVGPTVEVWERALRTGTIYQIAHRVRRKDGAFHWYLSRGVPATDDRGRITKWFGTATNIDDQKRVEIERVRLYEAEQQAKREAQEANTAKDRFVALVSHELRNPLSSIVAALEVLRRVLPPDERAARSLEIADRNLRLQTRLIDDLLDLSRLQQGKLRLRHALVTLGNVVETAVRAHEAEAAELGLDLTFQAEPGLSVLGDIDRLQQIVLNLLSNAVKFTPQGGSVRVTASRHNGRARITVADTGVGISPDLLGRLFRLFEQGDAKERQRPGLGIGLALVKQIAERHGGRAWAESEGPGRGSRFTVELPLIEQP